MMGKESNYSKMNCNVKNYKLKLILKGVTFQDINFSKCQRSSSNNYNVYNIKLRGKKNSFTIAPQNLKVNYFFYDHINPILH